MNNTKTNRLDWTKVVTNEARLTDVILVDDLAAKYSLAPNSVGKPLLDWRNEGCSVAS